MGDLNYFDMKTQLRHRGLPARGNYDEVRSRLRIALEVDVDDEESDEEDMPDLKFD